MRRIGRSVKAATVMIALVVGVAGSAGLTGVAVPVDGSWTAQ